MFGILYFLGLLAFIVYYSYRSLKRETSLIKFTASSKSSLPEQLRPWALAFISSDYYGLAMDQSKPNDAEQLKKIKQRVLQDWSLSDEAEILGRIDWLKKQGFRTAYPALLPLALIEISDEDRIRILKASLKGKLSYVYPLANNLAKGLKTFGKDRKFAELLSEDNLYRGILASDMGCLISLARVACALDLMREDELLECRQFAEEQCKKVYANWQELASAMALGVLMEESSYTRAKLRLNGVLVALNDKRSPWRRCLYI